MALPVITGSHFKWFFSNKTLREFYETTAMNRRRLFSNEKQKLNFH